MAEPWFRSRRPEQGQGYSVASVEGFLVSLLFVVATTASAVGVPILGRGSPTSIVTAVVLVAGCSVAFALTIRRHSQ